MTRREQIKNAYKLSGNHASFYDGMMTYSTILGKAICQIVWNMDGKESPVSGKGAVGDPGGFLREAAGGARRDGRADHTCLPGPSGRGHYLPGLFGEYDGFRTGKGESTQPHEYNLPAGRRRRITF